MVWPAPFVATPPPIFTSRQPSLRRPELLVPRVCSACPSRGSYRQDMPRGRMENMPGAPHLLAGQTSIDAVLKEQYDLAPQLPLHWAPFRATPPVRRRPPSTRSQCQHQVRLRAIRKAMTVSLSHRAVGQTRVEKQLRWPMLPKSGSAWHPVPAAARSIAIRRARSRSPFVFRQLLCSPSLRTRTADWTCAAPSPPCWPFPDCSR